MGESVNKDVSTARHTPSHTLRALNIIALHMCPSVQHPVFVTRQLHTGVIIFTHGRVFEKECPGSAASVPVESCYQSRVSGGTHLASYQESQTPVSSWLRH
ncbi:hypothetical protein J6590_066437 [Homalodisca vitripennis]|nr:hypothetical protein J6590_066437 [Homalodisca vitripennis]